MPPADLDRARALHASTLVCDLHADTFLQVRHLGYDLRKRHRAPIGWAPFMTHCDLPRFREGGVRAQCFGVVVPHFVRAARAHAERTLAIMRATFAAAPDEVALVRDPWTAEAVARSGRLAAFAGLEGAHTLEGDLEAVSRFHELGMSSLGLAHFRTNEVAASSGDRRPSFRGITPFGRRVIEEANRLGILVDLAHVHETSFFAAIDASAAPPIVSHAGARALRDHHRNLTDAQLRAVAARGGVVGVIFFPWYLSSRDLAGSIDRVVDHIAHVAGLVGSAHVALGSDFDGFVWTPRGLPDVSALPRLTEALVRRGFADGDVRAILGESFFATWRAVASAAGIAPRT